jgi:integrase
MPVRKRSGSPFFWYSFNLNGRRFRGSTGKTAKREAEEVERDAYQLAKRSAAAQQDWTLEAVLSTYWHDHAKHKASAYAIEGHFADLQRILGRRLKTSRLTDGALMDYRATRRGERRRGKFPAANSINREFAYLRAAYEHCHRVHKQPLPAIDWKNLKADEPPWRTRFLSRDEYGRLIAAADPRLRPIIVCAVATGLRQGNVLSLDWRQVQLDERAITVRIGKGNKERIIRIGAALVAVLSTMPSRRGKVFDSTNWRRLWSSALIDAEIENFRFHDLRHTFGSWARQTGADLADISEGLTHSNISMTLRYAHVKPDETITAADRVSERLLGTIGGTEAQKAAGNGETPGD